MQLGNVKRAAQYTRELLQNGKEGGKRRREKERGGEGRGGERCVGISSSCILCTNLIPSSPPHILPPSHPHTLPDPYHERGLSNLAYFESIKLNSPEQFTDGEETNRTREMTSEHERYQALCREAEPIVSCGEI